MKMKNNIIYKKREDKFLILNPQNGLWYVGKDESNVLGDFKDDFSIEKLRGTKFYEGLLQEGILENSNIEIDQPYADQLSLLILDTSKACNLACKYCFVDAPSKGTNMSLETAMKALKLALNYSKCADTLTIEFSGGEPLVNFGLIKEFIPKALSEAEKVGKKLTFTIQTNGTLLSEQVISFLQKYCVNIGISVDGTKDVHDKNRVFVDGIGSSDTIVSNIKKLHSMGCQTSILAVISFPDQYDSVIEFAEQNGITEIRTNLVTKAGRAEQNDAYTVNYNDIADKYISICKKILKGDIKIHDATLTFFLWNLLLSQPHMCFRSPCGAGTNQISVTSDGKIFPCQGWRNIHDTPICTVDEICDLEIALTNSNRVSELRNHNVRKIPVCESCIWSAFCGVCPREIYTEKGTVNERIGFCDFQAKVFEELIWDYDTYAEEIKQYLIGSF